MERNSEVKVRKNSKNKSIQIEITGILSVENAIEVNKNILPNLLGFNKIRIDLSGITKIDICGIQSVVQLRRIAGQASTDYQYIGPTDGNVCQLLQQTGFAALY